MSEPSPTNLNGNAERLCRSISSDSAAELGVQLNAVDEGVQIIDFGVEASGSLAAGVLLARICLADLGEVELGTLELHGSQIQSVNVSTNWPLQACMGSQYAGWAIDTKSYFAMCSGPVRAARGREPVIQQYGLAETTDHPVAVIETGKLPDAVACQWIRQKLEEPTQLTICAARTSSIAGSLQIVARSVETACHKLHEIGFDLRRIHSGSGSAPLLLIAPGSRSPDRVAMGRCNDSMLYGSSVRLTVTGSDPWIEEHGSRVPSCSSPQFGTPFLDLLDQAQGDFYRLDPMLFAPAVIEFTSADTGRSWRFGEARLDLLQ